MSQPISSGEASRHQRLMCVYCSLGVSPVGCRLPQPTMPTTSMSGSFQWPGPAYFSWPFCAEADAGHAAPGVADVAGGAPAVAADLGAPLPHVAHAVLAEAVDDVAVDLVERLSHDEVRLLQLGQVGFGLGDLAVGAPVVLQIIEAPLGITLGVLRLVLVAGR